MLTATITMSMARATPRRAPLVHAWGPRCGRPPQPCPRGSAARSMIARPVRVAMSVSSTTDAKSGIGIAARPWDCKLYRRSVHRLQSASG